MDFVLMSCPYCSRTVDSSDPKRYVCLSCGKSIYTDRTNARAFIRPGEIEESFHAALDAIFEDNEKKALDIANDLVESTEECDRDSLFLRGFILSEIGEDGKALADWRRGLELLSNDPNLDAYVCMMSKAIADMILYKEREFIEFKAISHIDKLCEDIDSCTGMSCKAFVYYSVYLNCLDLSRDTEDEEDVTEFDDIIPLMMKRIIAYHRNYWCLSRIIQEYLTSIDYNAETYEDDDNMVPHTYDLIAQYLDDHIAYLSEDDRVRIFDRWDDSSLKDNIEPLLDSLLKQKIGLRTILHRKELEEAPQEIDAVHAYVDKCLLSEYTDEYVPQLPPGESS